MTALPPGDRSSFGVASVQACVRNFEKIPDLPATEVVKRMRILRGYANDLMQCCNPTENLESYHNCQEAAQPAIEGLLTLVQCLQSTKHQEVRVAALTALTCISFNNVGNASAIVTSECFEPVFSSILKPIREIVQQAEILASMQLLQAICAVAPEAPPLGMILPRVVALLMDVQEGHAACPALRATVLEVLVSCSLSKQRRSQLASLLPESVVATLVTDAKNSGAAMAFPLGLVLANLSDVFQQAGSSGEPPESGIGKISLLFWQEVDFFGDLQACLEATLNSEPWPPHSNVYHAPWKLASTYLRLSCAGFRDALARAIGPLLALVERRAHENMFSSDDARAARLAAEVLRDLATEASCVEQMRRSQQLPEALVKMQSEELAAKELLERLVPPEEHRSYENLIAKPW